uniref:glucuronosyltransferase n=1 Tax=Syphacia muris TaxID=451379 RepID=A0A0N5AEB0_9BILA
MRTIFLITITTCLFIQLEGYKILINAPRLGHSHVNFLGRIADILVTAGHEVVVFVPNCDPHVKTNGTKLARVIRWRGEIKVNIPALEYSKQIWQAKSESAQKIYAMVQRISQMQVELCRGVLQDEQLLETLRAEKFDIGISELISFCGMAMFEKIGIKNYISASATVLIEGLTEHFGVSNNPSFVPAAFSPNSDQMSYFDRVQNTIIYLVSAFIIRYICEPLSQRAVSQYMPLEVNRETVALHSSYMFVNADEFLEFPRPITHKIVYIGGIAVPKPQPLDKAIETFSLPNVYKQKWIPQNDLLNHPKTRAFITHGGLNSITESVHAAIPLICIPLFGDQMRNAKMVEKRNIGIILDKNNLKSPIIVEALKTILYNERYSKESHRLAEIIANKPVSPEERIIKYVEFTAKNQEATDLSEANNGENRLSNSEAKQKDVCYYDFGIFVMKLLLLVNFICLFGVLEGYKILINAPRFGHSHVNFLGKIADVLVNAGHDVVFFVSNCDPYVKTNGTKLAKVIRWRGKLEIDSKTLHTTTGDIWEAKSQSPFKIFSTAARVAGMQVILCKSLLKDEQMLQTLKAEKFDIGISEATSFCGFALFEMIGLKNYIGASAIVMPEGISEYFGAINLPSFVPAAISSLSDTMSYSERLKNVFMHLLTKYALLYVEKPAAHKELFKLLPASVERGDLFARSSFYFVNAEEFLEFPRPISHKIIYIGGIAVAKPLPLNKEFKLIMESAKKGVILISFGSIAKSSLMKNETKKAFVETFKQFPDVNFIWKYETDDDVASDLPNVYKKKWVPQNDLLNHPNMKAFVTHSGLNSVTESVYAGVPLICVPLFGEQMRNARMAERRGVAVVLDKNNLNKEVITETIKVIMHDTKYQTNAKHLTEKIKNKPMPPEERIIKYTEFAAKFGPLKDLNYAGEKLNFIQYYLLDILVPFATVVILLVYICIRKIISIRNRLKVKQD